MLDAKLFDHARTEDRNLAASLKTSPELDKALAAPLDPALIEIGNKVLDQAINLDPLALSHITL